MIIAGEAAFGKLRGLADNDVAALQDTGSQTPNISTQPPN
jgi:hypothetical protein